MNPRYKKDPYKFVDETLGGFRIEEFVQSGGMGAVYRARSVIGNVTAAIKILKPDVALKNPGTADLLFREAEQTAALKHPNVIHVTYAGVTEEGWAYLVMEWLDGRSLEQELSDNGKMEPERVALLLEQVCGAVSYAHRCGLVHRDLKPNNIMLTRDHAGAEQVKVLDFGIAKAIDSTFGFNSRIIGAPHYASPEQLVQHANIDHRADIYSLGVTAYEMLTGEMPFDADTWELVVQQQLTGTPRPLSEVRPGIPQAVEAVIMRALAKRPGERFQDAQEFARAFRNAVSLGGAELNLICLDAETGAPLAGASVYLNGCYEGCTDEWGAWGRAGLLPREYLLEVECHRYERLSRNVRCTAVEGTQVEVGLTLRPFGELHVRARAAHATVTINNAMVGNIDESGALYIDAVAPGPARVQLSHPRFHAASTELEIAQGQEHRVEVEMRLRSIFSPARWLKREPRVAKTRSSRRRGKVLLWLCGGVFLLAAVAVASWQSFRYFTTGYLVVRGAPPGAQVSLDGVASGSIEAGGDLVIAELRRDTYLVEISADGFLRQQQQVEMRSRETAVTFALTPDAKLRVELGNRYFAENNFTAAEEKYREAVNIEQSNPEYYRLLAATLLKLNRADEAEAECRKAVRFDESNPESHRLLAEALLAQTGKEDEAESEYDQTCQLSPDKSACYYDSGVVWLKRSTPAPERALRALNKISLSPEGDRKDAPYLAERGAAYLALGQTAEALSDALRAVELDGDNAACQSVLGDVYSERKEYDKAVPVYRKLVNLVPTDDAHHFKLAQALYNRAEAFMSANRISDLNEAKKFYLSAVLLTRDADKQKRYVDGVIQTDSALERARGALLDETAPTSDDEQ